MSSNGKAKKESKWLDDQDLPDLPAGWCWTTVQALVDVKTGTTPRRGTAAYWVDGTIPWVTSTAVNELTVTEGNELVTETALKETNLRIYPRHTLILALYGEGKTRGKVSELLIDATINQALAALVMSGEAAKCRRFLKAFLQSNYEGMGRKAAGGMQPNLNLGIVKKIAVPLAPLNEQDRIVAKIEELFSDLDAGVVALERAKANLKRYRAAVLKAAVEGKLTAAWRAENPCTESAADLLQRILHERRQKWEQQQLAKYAEQGKATPMGWRDKYKPPAEQDATNVPELPDDWCWSSTGLLCECIVPNRDKPKSFSGDIPWMTLPDFDGRIELQGSRNSTGLTLDEVLRYKARLGPAGSVVMSCIGRFGISAVLGLPTVINQQLHAFLVPQGLSARYLAYVIRTQEHCMNRMATATTIAYLNKDNCNSVPIPLPPCAEQNQIVDEIEQRLSLVDEAESQIEINLKRATRLRQSILKRAFEGKLIPQDPADEPASKLLERINTSIAADSERDGSKTRSPRRPKRTRTN